MKNQEILELISSISSKYCGNCVYYPCPFSEEPCLSCGKNKKHYNVCITRSSRWLIDDEGGYYKCEHCGKISTDDSLYCPDCGRYMRG